MKKIYSDEQIVGFAREAERTEATISKFCQQKCFNKGIFISERSDSIQSRSPKLMRRENRILYDDGREWKRFISTCVEKIR